METTIPYPPPHEEVENENLQQEIAGSPLPVDDVARNQEQFMESISNTSPVDHLQPPPPVQLSSQVFVQSPMEVIEEVEYHHHHQKISADLLPENSVDCQIPPPQEDGEDQQAPPPDDKISDGEQPFAPSPSVSLIPPSPPLTEAEHPSENLSPNRESPLPKQVPSAEYPPGNPITYHESPLEHLKQPPSPSPPPGYSPEKHGFNHEAQLGNVSSDHESQLLKQPPSPSLSPLPPPTEAEYPSENNSPTNESPLSKQPPSPSLSPSPPATEAESLPENLGLNHESPPPENISPSHHESPFSKQPQSPSLSPPPAEADYPLENLSPKHKFLAEDFSPNHESPLSKQPPSPSPTEADESTLLKPPPSPSQTGAEEPPESPNPSPSLNLKQSPKDLSPSPPPHDTPEPNTRTPPLGVPLLLHAAATFSPSKPQISPWTHQETANLIQAYQEKWYSLKKGPLKAGQWEEVAITVAARCGYDEPTKTSKQCRHKIEKLRKRYRTERGKPRSKATAWNFFKLMDNLEKGPLPISSSQPMELVEYQKPSTSNGKKRKNNVYDDDEFLANKRNSTSRARNSNHHVANGGLATNLRFSEGGNRIVRGLRTPVIHKRKVVYQEEENNENVCEEEEEEEDVAGQLAAEIKGFAEKFVKMENKKIEMMRDVERYRLEMENKRMEMIIESQQMLVETVNNAFGSSVKTHRLSAS